MFRKSNHSTEETAPTAEATAAQQDEALFRSIEKKKKKKRRKVIRTVVIILLLLSAHTGGIEDFLHRLQELRELIANHQNDPGVPFLLSTIHSSKGLEYDRVYLLDVHDGVLPGITAADALNEEQKKTAAEERRLLYVAMTRAKNELCFFQYQDKPSSFLRELRPYLVGTKPLIAEDEENTEQPKPGDTLVHKHFGHGRVQSFNGQTVVLRFSDGSVRGFLWEYAVEKGLLRKE